MAEQQQEYPTYRVPDDMTVNLHIGSHGLAEYEFKAGDVTPEDEKQAAVLNYLAEVGAVEQAKEPRRSKRRDDETTKE